MLESLKVVQGNKKINTITFCLREYLQIACPKPVAVEFMDVIELWKVNRLQSICSFGPIQKVVEYKGVNANIV